MLAMVFLSMTDSKCLRGEEIEGDGGERVMTINLHWQWLI